VPRSETRPTEAPDPARAASEAASVDKLAEADRLRAIEALARAFYDDPCSCWIFPDDGRRARQLERGFAFFGRKYWFRGGASYATGSVAGAALWMAPDTWRMSPLAQLAMLPGMVRAVGARNMPRLLRFLTVADKKHPHDTHFYLPVIGVAPEWQGKGIGTALLQPVLEHCDREGIPAYLEASSPRNRACYERNGFVVKEEVRMAGDAPPWWPMWRDPVRGNRAAQI
jgi:GNAT superfamily N-acetyltransferase